MSTPVEGAFAAELADVRQRFIRSLEPRVVRLRELLPASANDGGAAEARAEIQAIAHKLAGSCASFGLKRVGDAAMTLEDKLIDAKAGPSGFMVSDAQIAQDVEALIRVCALAMA